ncbi:CPXV115 protein [Vaccinia virus]|nr:CPXV115 protein [Vaccinia virus]
MRALLYKDGKLFTDNNFLNPVSDDNPVYEVLQHVKLPTHLTDVVVYEHTWAEALTRLIFVGSDSK